VAFLHAERGEEKREDMLAEDFAREARNFQPGLPPQQLLQLVAYQEEGLPENAEGDDQNAAFRASVLKVLSKNLSQEDRPLIRFLLEQEIVFHENAWGIFESIRLCGTLLFLLAQMEDVHLLWEAKSVNFDTMSGFDIQLLVGAGVAPTLAYLQQVEEEWAEDARIYLEECQQAGDFQNLERYREGLRTSLSGPT
jgi:hypothetical protein